MALPVGFAVFMMLATGLLFALAWRGGTAEGDRVTLTWDTCQAAAPVLLARAEAVGLGDPVLNASAAPGSVSLTATLPGLEDDRTAIPALLSRPGTLSLRSGSTEVLTEQAVTLAQVRLDEGGLPYTWVELEDAAYNALEERILGEPEGALRVFVDGTFLVERPNSRELSDGGLRLVEGEQMESKRRMRRAVDRAIALTHGPLPCPAGETTLAPVDP